MHPSLRNSPKMLILSALLKFGSLLGLPIESTWDLSQEGVLLMSTPRDFFAGVRLRIIAPLIAVLLHHDLVSPDLGASASQNFSSFSGQHNS